MPLNLAFLIPSLLLGGCGNKTLEHQVYYPKLATSQAQVDFGSVAWGESQTQRFFVTNKGDMPMGISAISLGDDTMADSWSLSYSFANVECPHTGPDSGADSGSSGDGGAGDGGAGDGGAGDGGGTADSGADGGGTSDTAASVAAPPVQSSPVMAIAADTGGWVVGGGDTGATDAQVLGAGCKLPVDVTLVPTRVGQIYGAITVRTADEKVGQDQTPTYFADPDSSFTTVLLSGTADKGTPNAYVSPRAVDFGTVWEGDDKSMLVNVSNAGGGTLELGAAYLDPTCDDGFSIDWSYRNGTLLEADQLSGVQVLFMPPSDSAANCILSIPSNDPDEPLIDVPMQANVGTDPHECAPTVTLISPPIGYEHLNGEDLDVNFKVYDCNQPANTVKLSIRSGVLITDEPILVSTFYAPDESGYVEAKVPRDKLGRGTDTIIVRATDSAGNVTDAATSILYRSTFPASDDDGDGYGTDGETATDCDDSDKHSFPAATELYDGKDNDCDGVVDEGTIGYDDDGDGYSEVAGDCDDADPDTNPDATEIPDYRDNNCDGRIDENTTLADDDGDGYAESGGDCNDRDASIHPGATEFCDGIDNDCNGLSDERDGCVDLNSDPIIFGCIQTDRDTISVGETAHMSAFTYDPDGDSVYYSWQQDSKLTSAGYVSLDNVASASPTFTAPATIAGNKTEETYHFTLTVTDPANNPAYCAIDIHVTADPVALGVVEKTTVPGGCGSSGGNSSKALFVPGIVGLLALSRRRRKDGSSKR